MSIFGHSDDTSRGVIYNGERNFIFISYGICGLCTKKQFVRVWNMSCNNVEIGMAIRESQMSNCKFYSDNIQWISYGNFQDIKYIADD